MEFGRGTVCSKMKTSLKMASKIMSQFSQFWSNTFTRKSHVSRRDDFEWSIIDLTLSFFRPSQVNLCFHLLGFVLLEKDNRNFFLTPIWGTAASINLTRTRTSQNSCRTVQNILLLSQCHYSDFEQFLQSKPSQVRSCYSSINANCNQDSHKIISVAMGRQNIQN